MTTLTSVESSIALLIPIVVALVGTAGLLIAGRMQRAAERRALLEDRARRETRVRAYLAAAAAALHEVVDLQSRTGGVMHVPAIDEPYQELRKLFDDPELATELEPETISALGRALSDIRIAKTTWQLELDRNTDMDQRREIFKSLFMNAKAELGQALQSLASDPSAATYLARVDSVPVIDAKGRRG